MFQDTLKVGGSLSQHIQNTSGDYQTLYDTLQVTHTHTHVQYYSINKH
jgi:hypothetical protein